MSLFNCIDAAVNDPDVAMDRRRGEEAQALFNDLRAKYGRKFGPDEADRMAAADTKRIMREGAARRRKQVAKDISDQRRLYAAVTQHRNRKGELDPGGAIREVLANGGEGRVEDLYHTQKAIRRRLFFGLESFIEKHAKNLIGQTREKANLADVHRELLGETTGNQNAAAMARSLREAYETARVMFNQEGGNIPKLVNWAPQKWNKSYFKIARRDEWVRDMMEAADWDRIIDPLTGRAFGAGNASEAFLRASFDAIRTGGANKLEPSFARRGTALANQYQDMRQLHFKNADGWMKMAEKWGSPDLFDATMGYLETMSRDIARLKILGRNPESSLEYMIQVANLEATKLTDEAISRVDTEASRARNLLANISGDLSHAESEFMGNFFSGLRNVMSSAQLGSAIASSMTDSITITSASKGLGLNTMRLFERSTKAMLKGQTQDDLKRMLGVLETSMETSAAMMKFMGEASGPEITRRMASFTIRAQGLAHLTDINRMVFQTEIMGKWAADAAKPFDQIEPAMKRALEKSGVTADDWDLFRSQQSFEAQSGGRFLVPRDILDRADLDQAARENLFAKFQNMVEREVDTAVPSRDIRAESILLNGTRRGNLAGEFIRGGLQYKAFPISYMMNTIRRTREIEGVGWKIGYVAFNIAAMTLMGGLVIQIKNLIKGKEPDEMSNDVFWARAALQGGGLGLMGDFIASETNRFGGGIAETMLGPQVGLASDLIDLTAGNAVQAYLGTDTKIRKEATDLLKRYTPGSSLWQVRLVTERLVWDQLQLMIDPEAPQYLRERARNQENATGTGFWWEPGEAAPGG